MKDQFIILMVIVNVALISALVLLTWNNKERLKPQPKPQPFELRTIQVQQGKALITLCIDKRTEQAVPCTAFYTLP